MRDNFILLILLLRPLWNTRTSRESTGNRGKKSSVPKKGDMQSTHSHTDAISEKSPGKYNNNCLHVIQ